MDKYINGIKIDPIIFTHPFVKHCDVDICGGECCNYGVYVDKFEMEKILSLKDAIKEIMDETQTKDDTKWFEEPEEDLDFPSGISVGTEVFNDKCVFLDKKGFCTLQKLAISDNEPKWHYKPIFCVLFPFTIFEGTLTIDDEHLERMHYCNKPENYTNTMFEACKDELMHFLGEKGFSELLEYKKEFEKLNLKVLHT